MDHTPASLVAGAIGAGNFARRVLLPAAREAGFDIRTVVSSGGVSAATVGANVDAEFAASDVSSVLHDDVIDTVLVLTRHDTHAALAVQVLQAGKHVFVEKPLALTEEELEAVRDAREEAGKLVMVGFNRRFAPDAIRLSESLRHRAGPVSIVLTVNAGSIPADHWTQDPETGGGRIVGEACHFIDLARFLVGAAIDDVSVVSARGKDGRALDDLAHLSLSFEDGSTAVVHYLASGSRAFPKERIEAFWDGKTARIANWRRFRTWGMRGLGSILPRRQDKGHRSELEAFAHAVRSGGPSPIPFDQLYEVSLWSIRAARAARRDG